MEGSNRSRTAVFNAARNVARIRCTVAGESRSPIDVVWHEIASNASCTWAGVNSSNSTPPSEGLR
ncbi:hypothetical protein A6A08_21480 [Nocardiopsis sp. TSRI0078]|nr:hypothetical protein A6A08_21480 [Nocardiopsis sp. TSRI0078]